MAYFEVNKKPRLTFPTLTDSIVTFNSQYAGLPLKSHTVEVVATQSGSGTPSPDNVRTINGYSAINISATGKNLLDTSSISGTFAGVTYTNANGIVTINGTKLGSTFAPFTNARVSMRAGISYTFSINLLSGNIRDANQNLRNLQCYLISTNDVNMGSIVMYDTETIKSITVTPEEDIVVYPRFAWWSDNTIVTDLQLQMQIERNNVPTDYQPFGTYTTIQIGSTVYGGEYDARTGVLTVTHGFITINGSASWNEYASGKYYVDGVYPNYDLLTPSTPISNIYEFSGNGASGSGDITTDHKFYMRYQLGRVWVYDSDYPSLSDFTTMLTSTPMQIAYELATPQTIQLPPCPIDVLEGQNNIWADTGDTTVQYPKFG